jgi:outer membrane protein assembly factor BamB
MKQVKRKLGLVTFIVVVFFVLFLPLLAVAKISFQKSTKHSVVLHSASSAFIANSIPTVPKAGNDWPMYLHDPQRTSSSDETILAPKNASSLTEHWAFKTQNAIAASATIVDGTVFIGSWDGYEYALDEMTGTQKWRTFLGKTVVTAFCDPRSIGITSSASVENGVVYVGGGDAFWYALNAKTGAVLWKIYTGDTSSASGHYNWSSPLLYKGYAYIGIASNCDRPLVQGEIIQVSLQTHQVVNVFKTVADGEVGGGIWTSPSIDPSTNSLFFSSGTAVLPTQTLAQAIFVLDASTLELKASWKLPDQDAIGDSDFDTSPILFNDANGTPLVATVNKNGYIYVFNRNDVSAGPIWRTLVDIPGMCPLCEDSTVSSDAIGLGMLFLATGGSTVDGRNYRGSISAMDPATGKFLWRRGEQGAIIGALLYTNGLVIAAAGPSLEVLDAKTGTRLYSYTTGSIILSSPSLAHGQIFEGSTDGNLYAFGLPTSMTMQLADSKCLRDWACQDIGNPVVAGSEKMAPNAITVTAGGTGLNGSEDQLRFISKQTSGDLQLSARIGQPQATGIGNQPQIGLMVRQNSDSSSAYYGIFYRPHVGIVVQYRVGFGGSTSNTRPMPTTAVPLYLMIQRIGDQFFAATSSDGQQYTLVPGSNATVIMPFRVNSGFALSSDNVDTITTATIDHMTLGVPTLKPRMPVSPLPCPDGWVCGDIGNPALLGSQVLQNGVWTLQGGGTAIRWDRTDIFHYVWRPLPADGAISARVVSEVAKTPYTEAGIMVRQNSNADSAYYGVFMEPGRAPNDIIVVNRTDQGLITKQLLAIAGTFPIYLKVSRSGNSCSAYTSRNGTDWTLIDGSTNALVITGQVLVGLAVTSKDPALINTTTFDHVRIS